MIRKPRDLTVRCNFGLAYLCWIRNCGFTGELGPRLLIVLELGHYLKVMQFGVVVS